MDGQHETYPAEMLLTWKERQEGRMRAQMPQELGDVQARGVAVAVLSQTLIDREIEEQVRRLRRARFFVGFDPKSYAW